jgi:hypothetical protein
MESQELKLSEEDFKKVQEVRVKTQNNLMQIGQLTLKKNQYEAEIENLNMMLGNALMESEELLGEEKGIANAIVEKYGDIELNVSTGTYTKKNA